MLIERYFQKVQDHLAWLSTQSEQIGQAARLCADTLTHGGAIHVFDSGHLVSHELVHRAGGLVAFNRLEFSMNVNNPVKTRPDNPPDSQLSFAYIQHIFGTNQLRAGDLLFVGSVSGKTANVVELAIQARARGLQVIALTAFAYSSRLLSEHPSGKHLYEVADLVLDNGAPYGDAMLDVEGLEYPICPASGIGAVVTLWAVVAGIVEEMLAKGMQPTVYPSVNRPEGYSLVTGVEATAREKGY